MSLLLKALKQAESANAASPGAKKPNPANRMERALDLEPMATPDAAEADDWIEPPDMLFGNNGLTPKPSRSASTFRWPQLSLLGLTSVLAAIIAVGYGIYLYFALQPTAAVPPPPSTAAAPATSTATPIPVVPVEPDHAAPIEPPVAILPAIQLPQPGSSRPAANDAAASKPTSSPGIPSTIEPKRFSTSPQAALPQFQPDQQTALLNQAYAAYQRGALAEAQRLYTQAAERVRGVDALLGLAAIASVQNRDADAQRLYREVLNLDPRNATAQSALLDMLGNTDNQATESRLKTLIDRDPSPQLYQSLGTLYADQGRWNDAQAAYFEAYRHASDNADYAFNLAVSLDQLHQFSAALTYYEKALALKGVHRFDRAQAETRVQQLKSAQ